MKKIYLILSSIALLVACNKEVNPIIPEEDDAPEIRAVAISIEATQDDTKATYSGAELIGIWEDGDKLMALKGMHSQSNDATDNGSTLNLTSGQDTRNGKFEGNVSTSTKATDAAFWYFAYPASASAMSASVNRSGVLSYTYSYTNMVSITIPGSQDGLKWTPYLFAATDKLSGDTPEVAQFQTLSACLAIKLVAASDEYIPTKVKSIKIQSDQNNLYGTFSRIVNNNDTKIGSNDAPLTFSGVGNTFYKEYPEGTDVKEFRFNIPAGVETGKLTVTIVDDKGHTVVRYASSKSVEPGHKRNLKFTWEPESSFVTVTFNSVTAHTTYSYYKNGNLTDANKTDNRLKAFCSANVTIDGVVETKSYKFLLDNMTSTNASNDFKYDFTGLSLGEHSVVAIAVVNGKEYRSNTEKFYITGIPYNAAPPTTGNGWVGSGCEWRSSSVRLNSNDNLSLTLYTPADVDISLYEGLSITGKTLTLKYYLDCSGTRLASYERTYNRTTDHNETFNTTLKSANPVIKCISDASGASTSYADLKTITINYR